MKKVSFKELLKEYKKKLSSTVFSDEYDVNMLMMFRSALIDILDVVSSNELDKFLNVDSIFISEAREEILEANPDFKDFIDSKSLILFYKMMQIRSQAA